MNVLVIEDNADLKFLMGELLPSYVPIAEMRMASNEDEALVASDGFVPDVVVLDSCTGGPAPGDTARAMRARHPKIQIVSFSGMPSRNMEWADKTVVKSRDAIADLGHALNDLLGRVVA
jgi:chemotaxis response regulator CheB